VTKKIPKVTKQVSSSIPTKPLNSFFVDENLKQTLLQRSYETLRTLSPEGLRKKKLKKDSLHKTIPKKVKEFHHLFPLDDISKLETVSKVFNVSTATYKATSSSSGNTCTLKRIICKDVDFEEAELVISIFSSQLKKHPNIVQLKKCMMINEFESNDICVVYDFIPGCVSLEYKYFIETRRSPPESSLWCYTCQILMALKEIHDTGLAYRCLSSSTVLLRGKQRIYLNSIGMMDFLIPSDMPLKELQFQDLKDLGYLLLNLSLKSKLSKEEIDLEASFKDLEASNFSKEIIEFMKYLLNLKEAVSVDVVIQKIFSKFLTEMRILEE
jgi:hypothetical protein